MAASTALAAAASAIIHSSPTQSPATNNPGASFTHTPARFLSHRGSEFATTIPRSSCRFTSSARQPGITRSATRSSSPMASAPGASPTGRYLATCTTPPGPGASFADFECSEMWNGLSIPIAKSFAPSGIRFSARSSVFARAGRASLASTARDAASGTRRAERQQGRIARPGRTIRHCHGTAIHQLHRRARMQLRPRRAPC